MMKHVLLFFTLALAACSAPQQEAPLSPCVPDCHPWKCVAEEDKAEACTMIYKIGTQCYQRHSTCTRQADGKCGWTPSAELNQCIADAEAGVSGEAN